MSGLYSDFLGMAVFYYDAAGMNYNRIFEKTQKNVESFLEKLECIIVPAVKYRYERHTERACP